jgi:hypothetical protein
MGMSKDIKTTKGAGGCKYLKKSVCSTKSMENAQKDWKANMQNLTHRFWSTTRIPIAAAVLMGNMNNDAKTCGGKKLRRRLLDIKLRQLQKTNEKQQVPYVFANIPACKDSQLIAPASTAQPLPCQWNMNTKCKPAITNAFLRVQTLARMSAHSITNQAESCAKSLLKMKASMLCNSCNDTVDGEYLKGKWQFYI